MFFFSFFNTENFPTRLRFQFRSHPSQTFGESRKIFPRLRRYFFFDGIFGGEENVLGDCYTKAGWVAQNKVRKSV